MRDQFSRLLNAISYVSTILIGACAGSAATALVVIVRTFGVDGSLE
jgi:hypothetical protein